MVHHLNTVSDREELGTPFQQDTLRKEHNNGYQNKATESHRSKA